MGEGIGWEGEVGGRGESVEWVGGGGAVCYGGRMFFFFSFFYENRGGRERANVLECAMLRRHETA